MSNPVSKEKYINNLVSVIVPLYNAERFIRDTVRSILSQSYAYIELIIVDDGSTDGSVSIVLSSFSDPRIRIIQTDNHGAPHARNLGIDNARGEFLYFFDSDDIMEPDSIQKLINGIKDNNTDLAIGSFVEIDTNGKFIRDNKVAIEPGIYQCQASDLHKLMCYVSPFPGSKLYKAELIREYNIRFDEVKIAQDLNFYLKYLSVCKKTVIVDAFLAKYRLVDGSISHAVSRKTFDIVRSLDFVEQYYLTHKVNPEQFVYLKDLRIMNYKLQADKYVFIKYKKEAIQYYLEYYRLVEKIASSAEYLSEKSISALKEMRHRYKFRIIYFSSIYLRRTRRKASNIFR